MVIGRVLSIDELMDDYGFESVFIGSGAGLPRFMNIPVRTFAAFTQQMSSSQEQTL